jgi:benzoyl-CoA reductase/2-hydroxyglutaryl-CoA dehydratase subunit BcrC/BadD/HgdB
LSEGDINTSFFHACATQRKKRNKIKKLKTEDGSWVKGHNLCNYIATQYRALFQSKGVNRLGELIEKIERRVSPAMNQALLADTQMRKLP